MRDLHWYFMKKRNDCQERDSGKSVIAGLPLFLGLRAMGAL